MGRSVSSLGPCGKVAHRVSGEGAPVIRTGRVTMLDLVAPRSRVSQDVARRSRLVGVEVVGGQSWVVRMSQNGAEEREDDRGDPDQERTVDCHLAASCFVVCVEDLEARRGWRRESCADLVKEATPCSKGLAAAFVETFAL